MIRAFSDLISSYASIGNGSIDNDIYVLYPWLFPGVANSTKGLFTKAIPLKYYNFATHLGLPNSVITKLAKSIIDNNVRILIISGGDISSVQIVHTLKVLNPKINIYYLWHGSPAQWVDRHHITNFNIWVNLYREDKIKAIIVLKKNLEYVLHAYNIKSYLLQNFIPQHNINKANLHTTKFKIGLWSAYKIWIKNLYPQLVAIGTLKNVKCYTNFQFDKDDTWISDQIDVQNFGESIDHYKLLSLIAGTDLTLYITNTECSPMIALESLSFNVPCLVGPTSGIYDNDEYLKEMLTVQKVDCPFTISQAIERVRKNLDEIKNSIPKFIKEYNENAQRLKIELAKAITTK